jgi:hypothetical protein
VTSTGAPLFFMLWGGMFIAVGCYMVVGRFFTDAWQRRDMFYVLTDQRLIRHSGKWKHAELSTPLDQLGSVDFSEQSDGRGTIRYGSAKTKYWGWGGGFELPVGWPGASRYQRPSLDSIDDARDVYNQLRAAAQAAAPPAVSHTPAMWAADPTGRMAWRWWDGTRWTEHGATKDGNRVDDPL